MYTHTSVFLLLLVVLPHAGGTSQSKGAQPAELSGLLDRFQQSFLWHNSVSMDIAVEMSGEADGQAAGKTSERSFTFRRDHERVEWLGKWMIRDADGTIDPDARGVIQTINTGDMVANLTSGLDRPPIKAYLDRNEEANRRQTRQKLGDYKTGGPLWGRNMGNGSYNVAELLAQATTVHLQESPEIIHGIACQVVEAKTEYGEVKAWIAPEKGHAALKWSIQKKRGDRFDDQLTTVDSVLVEFTADDLQEVNGFWITKVGHLVYQVKVPKEGKIKTDTTRVKFNVSNVAVDPDFAALKAFAIDFPEGTPVSISSAPGIAYIWHNGKLTTNLPRAFVDELDGQIERLKPGGEEPPIAGVTAGESVRPSHGSSPGAQTETVIPAARQGPPPESRSLALWVVSPIAGIVAVICLGLLYRKSKLRRSDHA